MKSRRLAVISHVAHVLEDGRVSAYGPYAAEIDEWAKLFDSVTIAAPLARGGRRGDDRAFEARNIAVEELPAGGGPGLGAKLRLLAVIPVWIRRIWRVMRRADLVHVRCPGNVGLIGALVAPLAGRPMIAKYAGQWSGYPGEPWSFRLQRWILRNLWRRGVVLVYTDKPEAPHIIPFFNSALTAEQMERARAASRKERERGRLLFVGRLTREKGAGDAIEALALLSEQGIQAVLDIAGEGPERGRLEERARQRRAHVRFHGGVPFDHVLRLYEEADILLLPSRTEGWPKVLAEAMAFGVPCIATAGGLAAWMLDGGRGLTVPYGNPAEVAKAVVRLLEEDPEARAERRRRCAEFGQRFTLDGVREGIRELIDQRWPGLLAHAGSATGADADDLLRGRRACQG